MRRFAALALLFVDFSSVSDESQTSSLSAVTKTFCYYPKSQYNQKYRWHFLQSFFSELIFFYSFLHKRNVKMKGETKVTQTGLKKRRKILCFQCLADHHFWSPFLSFLCIGNTNCTKAFWGKYVWQKSLESSIFWQVRRETWMERKF